MTVKTMTLEFADPMLANQLFGPQNTYLTALAAVSGLRITSCSSRLTLEGTTAELELTGSFLTQQYELLSQGVSILLRDVPHAYRFLQKNPTAKLSCLFQDGIQVTSPRKTITPKTLSQREYINALRHNDITFGIGPAGTGKTYLAVAMALSMLVQKRVRRIILTRPAVEAGERLGFLPGDMAQKINPYLRPLYDALHDMLDAERVNELLETEVIEIAPLAFMRGRTLSNAFIILDEAQNTTPEQMKMFLTRLGFGSRAVITGDVTQIDLPKNGGQVHSGLVQALEFISTIPEIAVVHFHAEDVIRHPLVSLIVDAYAKHNPHSR